MIHGYARAEIKAELRLKRDAIFSYFLSLSMHILTYSTYIENQTLTPLNISLLFSSFIYIYMSTYLTCVKDISACTGYYC